MSVSSIDAPAVTPVLNPFTILGATSTAPLTIIDRLWDTFSQKGVRTVFVAIGNSTSSLADLELAESLGCPVNCVPIGAQQVEEWKEVISILKERKRTETATFGFSVGANEKWVLPKNIRVQESLPWWFNGTIDVSGDVVKTERFVQFAERLCKEMKVKDNDVRIDILKLDTQNGLERSILSALLDAGFRPAIIVVNWQKIPDTDLSTTLAAGHLQNSGYKLLKVTGQQFLYFFTNNDMYQICSWERTDVTNPMLNEIVESAKSQFISPTTVEVDGGTVQGNISTC